MSIEKRKELFEAVGLVAVVASLIVLTLEVHQNTNALYAQSSQTVLEGAMQELLLQFENPDIAQMIITEQPLTTVEQIRLDAFLSSTLRAREFAWLQYRNGVIDADQFSTERAVIGVIFDSSRIRRWWNSLGRQYASEGFVRFIDAELEERIATDEIWREVTTWDTE